MTKADNDTNRNNLNEAQKAPKGDAQQKHDDGQQLKDIIQKLKNNVSEEDASPTSTLTLRKILGGDILSADMVRRQIWLCLLILLLTVIYVGFRYQCQRDMIAIDKLKVELKDAKYKALTSSSDLTEKCRESHVLDALKANEDSLLHIADRPPFIINIPE